jgi:hypothetical protein
MESRVPPSTIVQGNTFFPDVPPVLAGSLALVFSVGLYFPGYLSFDSAFQFWQARTGHFSNQSPVVMTALWQAVNALWPSPAAMLTLHFLAYWTGLVLLALQFWDRNLPRVAFILGIGFLPPAFVIMGHLWTDASLIAAMTLAFGLTVTGLVERRPFALALAAPLILYSGAVRHNSLLALIPLAMLWAQAVFEALPARRGAPSVIRRRFSVAAIAVLAVAASFGFGRTLDLALARERVSTWALVAGWDLAAISVRTGTMVVPAFARTPGLTLDQLRQQYTPLTNVPVFIGDEHVRYGMDGEVYSDEELRRLRAAWLATIAAHPWSYAAHRADVTAKLFGRYDGDLEGLFFSPTVVPYRDNPPAEAALWNLRDRYAELVRATRGWLIFMPALYLAIAAGVSLWAWPRKDSLTGRIALAAAGSGLLLVLPLTIAAPSAELRYSGWLFVSSIIGLAACGARITRAGRRR